MQNMMINGLLVHDLSDPNPRIWLNDPIEGFDAPEYRLNEYDRSSEDGGYVSSAYYGSRAITLSGMIVAGSLSEYESMRKELIQAVSIQRDKYSVPVGTTITFTTLAGTPYKISAFFKKPEFAWDGIKYGRFLLQATVPDPFIYDVNLFTSENIAQATGGGYQTPHGSPYYTNVSMGGGTVVVNDGGVEIYPIITLTGSLTNPIITNQTSGLYLKINYTLAAGDTIIVDMRNKTMTLNNSSSLLSTKTVDSNWWPLSVGNNSIQLATDTAADTGNVSITYNKAYVGV